MINQLIKKAQRSPFRLWLLNIILWWKIPFNLPHRIKIIKIEEEAITMLLPFRKRNKNHINSMHACALATICEYITGITLAKVIDPEKYRFILQKLEMSYKYQAKKDVIARMEIPSGWIMDEVLVPLRSAESVIKEFKAELFDTDHNLICIGSSNWQIKKWDAVKTKV